MQLPTNYKMGTGLAATIMGQQAGLEAEQTGLANVIKGMQMPTEALKGQESAMLMQNPEYLQQKVQNTMIDLRNQYSAADFQETLNSANRIGIELDAAGGDPAKEQQIVDKALTALKIDPRSEFAQYARRDPRGALTKFKQGVETSMIGAQGGKHLADMEKERFTQGEQTARTKLEIASKERTAGMSADAQRYAADAGAAYKDTSALLTAENNLRQRVAQIDNTIEHYARGDADAEIISSIRKKDPKKTEAQAKSEAKIQREAHIKQLRDDRTTLSQRADQIGEASLGRLKLGQKPPEGSPTLPPGVTRK